MLKMMSPNYCQDNNLPGLFESQQESSSYICRLDLNMLRLQICNKSNGTPLSKTLITNNLSI